MASSLTGGVKRRNKSPSPDIEFKHNFKDMQNYIKKYKLASVLTPPVPTPPISAATTPATSPAPPPINKINLGSSPNLYDLELIENLEKLYANYFTQDTDNRYIEIFGLSKSGVEQIKELFKCKTQTDIDSCKTPNLNQTLRDQCIKAKQECGCVDKKQIIDNARYLLSRCDTLHDFMFGPRSITVKKLKKDLYQKDFRMLNGRIEKALNTTEISKDNLLRKIDYKPTLLKRLITHSSLNKLEEKLSEFNNKISKGTDIYYYTYKSNQQNLTITTPKELEKVILTLDEDIRITKKIKDVKIYIKRRTTLESQYGGVEGTGKPFLNLYIKNYNRKVIGGWTLEKDDLPEEEFMVNNNLEILRKYPFYYKNGQNTVEYKDSNRTINFTKLLTINSSTNNFIVTNDSEASLTIEPNIQIKSTNYFNNKTNIDPNIPIWSENQYMLNTSQLQIANTINKSYTDIQIGDKIYIVWTDPDNSEPYLATAYICEIYDETPDYVENTYYKNIFIIYQDNNRDNFKLYKNLYNKTTENGWAFDPRNINDNDIQDEKYTNLDGLEQKTLIQMVTKNKNIYEFDVYKVKTIEAIQEEEIDLANSQQNDIQNLKMKKYYREVTLQKLDLAAKYNTIETKLNEYLNNLSSSKGCDIKKNSDEDENLELDEDEDLELDLDDEELDEEQSGGDPTIPDAIFDFDKYKPTKQKIIDQITKLKDTSGIHKKFTELLTKIYNDIKNKNLDKIPNKYVKLLKFLSKFLVNKNAKNCILNMINYVYKYDIDDDFVDYNEVPNVKLYYYKYGQDDIEYGWTLFTDMFDIRSKLEDDVFDKYNQNITEYIEDYLNHKNIITFNAIINAENNYILREKYTFAEENFNYNLATIEFKNPEIDSQFKNPSDNYKACLVTIKKYFILPNSNRQKIKYCVDTGNKFVTNSNKQELECNILHEWDSAKNQCKVEDLANKPNKSENTFPISGSSEPDDLKFILFSDYKNNFKIEYKDQTVLLNDKYIGISSSKKYEKLSGTKLGSKQSSTKTSASTSSTTSSEIDINFFDINIAKALNCKKINKNFDGTTYTGTIEYLGDKQKPYAFKITYTDGDEETMTISEIFGLMPDILPNILPNIITSEVFYIYKTVDLLLLAMIDMDPDIRKYSPISPALTDFNNKIYDDDSKLNFPLDIKRSGDACQLIRTKYLNAKYPDTLYIFVTIDELAFLSARLQNIPAILIHYKNYRIRINDKYELKSYIKLTLYHPYKIAQKIEKKSLLQEPPLVSSPTAQTPPPVAVPPPVLETPSPAVQTPPPVAVPPPVLATPSVAPVVPPPAKPEKFYNAVENFKGERKRKRETINEDTFYDIEDEPESKRRETFIEKVCDNGIGFINTNFNLISAGFKKILNITGKIEKKFSNFFGIKKQIQKGGSPDEEYFESIDPLLFDDQDNLILQIFEESKQQDISNIYYNTSAYYRFIMDLRNVSDINEIINMTVEFVMYRIALWNLDYDYQYFEEKIRELEKKPQSEIISDPVCKKCISQYEYYEAILKYYLLLQLDASETLDLDLPEFNETSDGRDIMCYIMSKPYDMYVKYKDFFSLQYFKASNIDSEIQIKTSQQTPSPPPLTAAQQMQQNKLRNRPNTGTPQLAYGGSSAPKTQPKGPLKLLDYHKKYFPAYEKLYYSGTKK